MAEKVLKQQRDWVGRSEGADVDFQVKDRDDNSYFTTRIDTIFGATAIVMAPDHPCSRLCSKVLHCKPMSLTSRPVKAARAQADPNEEVVKEGLFTVLAINPFNGESFCLGGQLHATGYGTGL